MDSWSWHGEQKRGSTTSGFRNRSKRHFVIVNCNREPLEKSSFSFFIDTSSDLVRRDSLTNWLAGRASGKKIPMVGRRTKEEFGLLLHQHKDNHGLEQQPPINAGSTGGVVTVGLDRRQLLLARRPERPDIDIARHRCRWQSSSRKCERTDITSCGRWAAA